MDYQREMMRIKGLLSVGAGLLVIFLIGFFARFGTSGLESFLEIDSYLIFAFILLYPLGLVYNWRNMLDLMTSRNNFHSGYARMMSGALKFGFAIAVGWIPGLYYAYQIYKEAKKEEANMLKHSDVENRGIDDGL